MKELGLYITKLDKGGSTYAKGGEIKEFDNFKDYVREIENDEHEKYILATTDMYLKDRDFKSIPFKGKKEFESLLSKAIPPLSCESLLSVKLAYLTSSI